MQKLLIVEDEEILATLFLGFYKRAGFDEVLWAKSVAQANHLLDNDKTIVAAIIDEGLPDGSGCDVGAKIVELRQHQSPEEQMPFVILSGSFLNKSEAETGASAHMMKPDKPKIACVGLQNWLTAMRAKIPPAPLPPSDAAAPRTKLTGNSNGCSI